MKLRPRLWSALSPQPYHLWLKFSLVLFGSPHCILSHFPPVFLSSPQAAEENLPPDFECMILNPNIWKWILHQYHLNTGRKWLVSNSNVEKEWQIHIMCKIIWVDEITLRIVSICLEAWHDCSWHRLTAGCSLTSPMFSLVSELPLESEKSSVMQPSSSDLWASAMLSSTLLDMEIWGMFTNISKVYKLSFMIHGNNDQQHLWHLRDTSHCPL